MSPRSAGFDEIEQGYAPVAVEDDEPREPEHFDDDEEDGESGTQPAKEQELDEFALAEQEYLAEMRSGMMVNDEDGVAI